MEFKHILPSKPCHKNVSIMPSVTVYTNETCIEKDEWNTGEIIDEHILRNERLLIRGDVPGTEQRV